MQSLGPVEMERRLKITHMTADDLRLMLGHELTAQESLTRQLDIHVTDADAKKYFEDNPGDFDQPAKAHIRELLLLTTSDFSSSGAPPLPAATIQAKRKQIDELLNASAGVKILPLWPNSTMKIPSPRTPTESSRSSKTRWNLATWRIP